MDHPSLQPLDTYNQTWARNVHPDQWLNPDPKTGYDLVVVGAGPAGLVTAAAAASLGANVALIEKGLMGGDCLNVGCVPSKALIRASRAWVEAANTEEYGMANGQRQGKFAFVMERIRRLRADLSEHDSVERFSNMGVDVYLGTGAFNSPHGIMVEGKELKFHRAVIATGARAAILPVPGLAEAGYFTNETIFTLTTLPARLAVICGGPIGCELAQAFARLGSHVTLITKGPVIMPREDADASALIQAALIRDGVRIMLGAKISAIRKCVNETFLEWNIDGQPETMSIDAVLLAIGRRPNIEALNLTAAGVEFDSRTGVIVDDLLCTSNHRIYSAGDVCSKFQFTHTADAMARIVIRNALFFGRQKVSRLIIPWCTYTDPEIAHVQKASGLPSAGVKTIRVDLSEVDRAVLDSQTQGFLKIYLAGDSDTIHGATLVAPHAGEMISEITLAMTAGLGLGAIGNTIHPYPTHAEIFKRAADQYNRGRLTPRVKAIMAWLIAWRSGRRVRAG